ncbi:sugar phosphate isomerase/epimerase family protein [Compostibacter hankyongensis]
MNRRQFISSVSTVTLGAGAGMLSFPSFWGRPPIRWAMGVILWRGYAARRIPLQEVIQDMHDLGLDGVEYSPRKGELERNGLTRESFRDLLRKKKLAVSAHYWGAPFYDAGRKAEIVASFRETMESLKFYGSKNIVVGPGSRKAGDPAELIRKSAPLLNELGKMALDQGIQIGIHPHYNTFIEKPGEIDLAMELTDPRYVHLSPDTGHLAMGGGNVLEILRTYKDRLNYFHFKDVAGEVKRPNFGPNLRELGKGEVDLPAVMRLLKEIKFRGWINQEQDSTRLTPRESATQSIAYINAKLKPIYGR